MSYKGQTIGEIYAGNQAPTERHGVAGGEAGLREALAPEEEIDQAMYWRKKWHKLMSAYDAMASIVQGETVSLPVADYKTLVAALEADDTFVKCEICGAWLTGEENSHGADINACWARAVHGGDPSTCRSYRAALASTPRQPSPGASGGREALLRYVSDCEKAFRNLTDEEVWLLEGFADSFHPRAALAVPSQPVEMAGAEEVAWRPMDTAPHGKQIVARHKPNKHTPHGWIATIVSDFDDPDEHRRGGLDTILHYNGDTLQHGFHGCWLGWMWPEELAALRTRQDTRATTTGPWLVRPAEGDGPVRIVEQDDMDAGDDGRWIHIPGAVIAEIADIADPEGVATMIVNAMNVAERTRQDTRAGGAVEGRDA